MKKLTLLLLLFVATITFSFAITQKTSWQNHASEPFPPAFPKKVRTIEIRYFPDSNGIPHHPDQLSPQLREIIRKGSAFHSYKDSSSIASVNIDIVRTINHNNNTPSGSSWREIWDKIFEENNLCNAIASENIDYVWVWSNSEPEYSTGPGIEYAISSKYFQNDLRAVTVANPPFCGGDRGLSVFNFAYNREVGEAGESFGHYMEGLITNFQGHDFFWQRYAGASQGEYLRSERCGAVHFPPNVSDSEGYIYYSQRAVSNFCENWQPEGRGQLKTINCDAWNCDKSDFFIWWMANMPNRNNSLTFNDKPLPNWWGLVKDLDVSLISFWSERRNYLNDQFFVSNNVPTIPQPFVKNDSFENATGSNLLPKNWTTKKLERGDQVVSEKSYEGYHSFKFSPSIGKIKKSIKQTVSYNGTANQAVTFVFLSKTNKELKGMAGGILRINYADGTATQVALKIPRQIHNWSLSKIRLLPSKAYSSLDLTLYNSNSQSAVWYDAVSLDVALPNPGQMQTETNLSPLELGELDDML